MSMAVLKNVFRFPRRLSSKLLNKEINIKLISLIYYFIMH